MRSFFNAHNSTYTPPRFSFHQIQLSLSFPHFNINGVNNCITITELADSSENSETGNYKDILVYLNKMRGAASTSVGIATIRKDINAFLDFVKSLKDKTIANNL